MVARDFSSNLRFIQDQFNKNQLIQERINITPKRPHINRVVMKSSTLVEDQKIQDGQIQLGDKVLYIMRHGTTYMNEWLYQNQYDGNSVDPMLYDTRLTERGVRGAKRMVSVTAQLNPQPQVIIASPLTRALQTAELAFADVDCPRVAERLGREKIFHASDIGRPPHELQQEFPNFDFGNLPEVWWYTGGAVNPKEVNLEPWDYFKQRVWNFKTFLSQRPEQVIAVVLHWGVIRELTGLEFGNCELRRVMMSDLQEMM